MEENSSINRIYPRSIESERAIIGAILLDPDVINEALSIVHEDDFYDVGFKVVFKSMHNLHKRNSAIDSITLSEEIKKNGEMDEVAQLEFFKNIIDSSTSSVNIRDYCNIVKEKAVLRRLINEYKDLQDLCFGKNEVGLDEIIEESERRIFNISQNRKTNDVEDMETILYRVLSNIEKAYNNKTAITGVSTGFYDLDSKTSGLQNSDLILIAARPAMGKTAFALNIAKNAAVNGVTTVIFSLEMSKEQLASRLLAMESSINATRLRTGDFEDGCWSNILESMERLIDTNLIIDDTGSINVAELRSKCRKLKSNRNLGLVIIDYLQLMNGGRRENRQQEISEISRSLKILAREINVPVIALSQLSRACEQRADHRPMLSDLRESGAIEQDADIVMLLYREGYYDDQCDNKDITEVIIAKHRNGPTGTVELKWLSEFTKFANLEKNK